MAVNEEKRRAIQSRVINSSLRHLKYEDSILIKAPTGFGKTTVFTNIISELHDLNPSAKTLITQDLIKLAEQNKNKAIDKGLNATVSSNGEINQNSNVVYGVTPTIFNNLDNLVKYDNLVIDEVQHAADNSDSMHSAIITKLKQLNPDLKIIAATATDRRPDGLKLHPIVENARRESVTQYEAEQAGCIVPIKTVIPSFNLKNSKSIKDLVDEFSDPANPAKLKPGIGTAITQNLPDNYFEECFSNWQIQTKGHHEKTFAYTNTIKDAEKLRDVFVEHGVNAMAIHSGIKKEEQDRIFRDYRSGKISTLVSVDMLIEGVDEPPTKFILLAKKHTTELEYTQIKGRAKRAYTEKDESGDIIVDKKLAIIIDMGASSYVHGLDDKRKDVEIYLDYYDKEDKKNLALFRPWHRMKLPEGSPFESVHSLYAGRDTYFYASMKNNPDRKVLYKAQLQFDNQNRSKVAIGLVADNPPHKSMTKLTKSITRKHQEEVVTLLSRQGATRLDNLLAKRYDNSKGSLELYGAQYLRNITAQNAKRPINNSHDTGLSL
jgi:DNA repair protein RadD